MQAQEQSMLEQIQTRIDQLSEEERQVLMQFLERNKVTRNVNTQYDTTMSLGDRVADRIAAFGGSWTFILLFGGILISWIIVNTLILSRAEAFDPYPYILLNLMLSMIAAFQAPVILMSQNRQTERDRLDAENDYKVNLKAELDILSLHQKLNNLREQQLTELLTLQQTQIELLKQLIAEPSSPGTSTQPNT